MRLATSVPIRPASCPHAQIEVAQVLTVEESSGRQELRSRLRSALSPLYDAREQPKHLSV
jgi:hypothetical protein